MLDFNPTRVLLKSLLCIQATLLNTPKPTVKDDASREDLAALKQPVGIDVLRHHQS